MYNVFELPEDFLSREYTQPEKSFFDKKLTEAIYGPEAITEELTPEQKQSVDSWTNRIDPKIKSLHDKVFGQGVDRISIPYDSSKEESITSSNYESVPEIHNVRHIHHHEVIKNITRLGYRTSDYVAGFASHMDTPDKKVKISKILETTGVGKQITNFMSKPTYEVDENGAYLKDKRGEKIVKRPPTPMTLSQVYAADPVRAASKKEKQIIITRNPYDVAGMSTGRGWRSCMHMVDGGNRHYLPNDIHNGTLTAYVATVDDNNLKSPIGRINLKRFDSRKDGSSIFRQENASYGTIPTNMKKVVKEWAEKNYQPSSGVYLKHSSLYNDDGNAIRIEKPELLSGHEVFNASNERAENILRSHQRMIDNMEAPSRDHDWDDFYGRQAEIADNGKWTAMDDVKKLHDKLNAKEYASAIIHAISDHSLDYAGKNQEEYRNHFQLGFHDGNYYTFGGSDVVHAHAINAIGNRSDFDYIKNGISEMTPDETLHHLTKIHEGFSKSVDEPHPLLKEVHSELINHMFGKGGGGVRPEFQHVMDHELSHMASGDNHEYYSSLEDERGNNPLLSSDVMHPVALTKNPRLMHTIINHGSFDSPAGDHYAMEHMGEHADAKLAHHVMTTEEFGDSQGSNDLHFMKGLNKNKDGEKIQHQLIKTSSQMPLHLTGGEYKGQGELLPVTDTNQLRYAMSGMHRTHPFAAPNEEYMNTVASIAYMTKHPSVYNAIKERATNGDLDHPQIHSALNDNWDLRDKKIDESVNTFISFAHFRKSKKV